MNGLGSASGTNDVVLEPAQALWLLSSFGTLYQKSIDLDALARECAQAVSVPLLARLASDVGLEVSGLALAGRNLNSSQLPLAVEALAIPEATGSEPGAGEGAADERPNTEWLLVLQIDADRALIARQGESTPSIVPTSELQARMTGRAIRCRLSAPELSDPDASLAGRREFGFHWFIPELLKYRSIWREVLTASLVLQLMALAVPLFTQTIIDKVVVHRTESTLIALAIGMAIFIVFTASLSWVRQYLVLHTGNRVDVVLGRHIFEHLFKLPLLYFQHRPTGVIAARLHSIETIREFISSAAVTLMLDLPFLFIFVAVMFWYSVKLTLIVLAILLLIVGASLLVAPLFQRRLNEQFMRGAANQAFVTEYIAGVETVKSLQLEPQINRRYRDLLAAYLDASFKTRQLGNSYGTLANGLEQMMTLLILAFGAWLVMTSASFTVGMLVAFQMFASRLPIRTARPPISICLMSARSAPFWPVRRGLRTYWALQMPISLMVARVTTRSAATPAMTCCWAAMATTPIDSLRETVRTPSTTCPTRLPTPTCSASRVLHRRICGCHGKAMTWSSMSSARMTASRSRTGTWIRRNSSTRFRRVGRCCRPARSIPLSTRWRPLETRMAARSS